MKISQTPIDITTLAKTIAKQTGLQYSLNMQNASLKKHISLKTGNWQLSEILKQVQQQAGLNYKILGDHILFMDYKPPVNKTATANNAALSPLTKNVAGQATTTSPNKVAAPAKSTAPQVKTAPDVVDKNTSKNAALTKANTAASTPKTGTVTPVANTVKPIAAHRQPTVSNRSATANTTSSDGTSSVYPEKDIIVTLSNDYRENLSPLSSAYKVSTGYTPKMFSLSLFDDMDSIGGNTRTSTGIRYSVQSLMKSITIAKETSKGNKGKNKQGSAASKLPGIAKAGADGVKWYQPSMKAGFSADEILYLNATMTAGIKYAYGIISYGTTFTGGRFRWGAGIPVKLDDEQQLHFTFTTGTLKRRTDPDSVIVFGVQEQLTRYGAGWSKIIAPRLTFQAQLHYNILKKISDSTSSFNQQRAGDYKKFEYGKAPYTLSESYGETGDFKRWIGIQVSLFYKLF